jgi:hypothetical protein
VRRNSEQGDDIINLKNVFLSQSSLATLYGAVDSPQIRFRFAIQNLKDTASSAQAAAPDSSEYVHQVNLLWSKITGLKEFFGTSPVIDEIVAELRTARFQHLRKDTPPIVVSSINRALEHLLQAQRFDDLLTDQIAEILESSGIDSLAIDSHRPADA